MASGRNEVALFLRFVMILQILLSIHHANGKDLADMQPPQVEELIDAHVKELTDEDLLRSPVRKS